jgi:tyrosine-protein phosphatase YwqE
MTSTSNYKHKIEKRGYVKQSLEKLQNNSTLLFRNENYEKKRPNKKLRQLVGSGINSTVSQD